MAYNYAKGKKKGAIKSCAVSCRESKRIYKALGGPRMCKTSSKSGSRASVREAFAMAMEAYADHVGRYGKLPRDEIIGMLSGEIAAPTRAPSVRLQPLMVPVRKRQTSGPGFKIATRKVPPTERLRNRR